MSERYQPHNPLNVLTIILMAMILISVQVYGCCAVSIGAQPAFVVHPSQSQVPASHTWRSVCPGGVCPTGPRMVPVTPPPGSPPIVATPAAAHHGAVLRVVAGSGTVTSVGTGTLIDERGLVLTAAHVVVGQSQATALWSDGYQSSGKILCIDQAADIAAFRVTPPKGAVVIPLAQDNEWPPQGASVELCGYGGAGPLRHWRAPVHGYAVSPSGKHHTLSVATQTINGDSGGPMVFNGKLVAVLWGSPLAGPNGPMIATHGTYAGRIRAILGGCNCLPKRQTPQQVAPAFPQVQQTPVIVRPVQPPTNVSPAKTTIDYARLLDLMAADERFKPQPPSVDRAALLRDLIQRLPPVVIEMYDDKGVMRKRQARPLGQPIRFQRVPVN